MPLLLRTLRRAWAPLAVVSLPVGIEQVRERVGRAIVSILVGDETSGVITRLEVCTGVLVELGGTRFVLTAAHNLIDPDGRPEQRISVLAPPRNLLVVGRIGDGSVASSIMPERREPDVAVLILGEVAMRTDAEPFLEHEIGRIPPDAPEQVVAIAGFPSKFVDRSPKEKLDAIGTHLPMWSKPLTLVTKTIANRRSSFEPKHGRGLHVHVPEDGTNERTSQVDRLPPTFGMSGGPVVDARGSLVGLVRSREKYEGEGGGYDQWCEPAVEAIALLHRFEAAEVAAAVDRILKRLRGRIAGA